MGWFTSSSLSPLQMEVVDYVLQLTRKYPNWLTINAKKIYYIPDGRPYWLFELTYTWLTINAKKIYSASETYDDWTLTYTNTSELIDETLFIKGPQYFTGKPKLGGCMAVSGDSCSNVNIFQEMKIDSHVADKKMVAIMRKISSNLGVQLVSDLSYGFIDGRQSGYDFYSIINPALIECIRDGRDRNRLRKM